MEGQLLQPIATIKLCRRQIILLALRPLKPTAILGIQILVLVEISTAAGAAAAAELIQTPHTPALHITGFIMNLGIMGKHGK